MMTRGSVRTTTASTKNVEASIQPTGSAERGRGRGRGTGRGDILTPSVQLSVTSGQGRGRPQETGRGALSVTDDVLTEKITQVLQATLPSMLATFSATRNDRPASPVTENTDENVGNRSKKGCNYKTFNCTRPKEFLGEEGPVALMNWINKIERCFSICECPPEQKVKFAATTFCDATIHLWNAEK